MFLPVDRMPRVGAWGWLVFQKPAVLLTNDAMMVLVGWSATTARPLARFAPSGSVGDPGHGSDQPDTAVDVSVSKLRF